MLVFKSKYDKLLKENADLKEKVKDFNALLESNGKLRGILDNVVGIVKMWKAKEIGNLRAISTLKSYLLDTLHE